MTTINGFAEQSIGKTYRRLRYLISFALVVLPLLTAASAFWLGRHPLQPSLSDYYFAEWDGGLPRTVFVTFLAALGSALIAYRGLDSRDDLIHNFAGFCALGVAFFPMQCDTAYHAHCKPGLLPMLHLPSAGLLYLCAVLSVLYGGGPNLRAALGKLPDPKAWLARRDNIRFVSAALMTIGIASFFVHNLMPNFLTGFSWIFWIEYAGFFGFGLYWLRLMLLINAANDRGRRAKVEKEAGRAAAVGRPAAPAMTTAMQGPLAAPQIEAAPQAEAEQWVDIP